MTSSTKCKIVIDTNVFVSGVVFGVTPKIVLDFVRLSNIELLMSQLLAEEILAQMYRFRIEEITNQVVRYTIFSQARMIAPRIVPAISRDPKDDMLLALSLAGKAEYLITGDKDLLILRTFERTKIVTPSEFLTIYKKS